MLVVVAVDVVQIGFAVTTAVKNVNDAVLVEAGLRLKVESVTLPFVVDVGALASIFPFTIEKDCAATPLNLTAVTISGLLV